MLRIRKKRCVFLSILIVLWHYNVNAQLKPGFNLDNNEGCTPLAVHFTNTTTGASPAALFSWNFGNGNISNLKDAGAIFRDEKTYTVTLTVSDSGKTSVISHPVTVYPKPTVDFSISLQKGCAPLQVTLTGKTGSGDSIANYYWDFGDGNTGSSAANQITHNYIEPQNPAISLTLTDIHGCQGTILKQDLLTILPAITASFSVDKNVICKLSDGAKFSNSSTGPETLSYLWNFGDSTTSVTAQPSHVFSKAGNYTIALTVNSSSGCSITSTQNNLINAANFKSEVNIPVPVCENVDGRYSNITKLDNKSTPIPDKSIWDFGDGYPINTTGSDSVLRYFAAAGSYTLKLTNTFGTCTDVLTLPIVVQKSPDVKGFIDDLVNICGSPATVNFKDTTAGAVKWQWSSSGYTNFQSTEQVTSYNFLYDDSYYVTLKVTDNKGCMGMQTKTIDIHRPNVVVSTPEDYHGNGVVSCGPITVHLLVTSSEAIKSYSWDLGDGTSSTDSAPVHQYTKEGNYYVHLKYITVNGCSGTADLYYPIAIRDKVKADFEVPDTNICGNTPLTFNNLTPLKNYYTYTWDFGDGQTGVSYWNEGYNNIVHQYQKQGIYNITLISSDGTCADTISKKGYIKVSPPFPKIDKFTNTCEGTRGQVTFTQSSTQVLGGTWNFGDGTTASFANVPKIIHTYTKTGFYHVVLTTTNGTCTVGDSTNVTVLLKQHAVLTGDKTTLCSWNDFLNLTYSNLEVNPSVYSTYNGYNGGGWYHKDGSYAIGQASLSNETPTSIDINVWNFTPGDSLGAFVTSVNFGCVDSTNFIPLTIKGPIPGFRQINQDQCGSSNTVTLEDTSKSRFGSALVTWQWDFGDGISATYNHGGQVTHTYRYQGYNTYNVTLTVTDAGGCSSLFYAGVVTSANKLKASFNPSATTISPGSLISFINTSQTSDIDNTFYNWTFGDGTSATSTDAVKTFSKPGSYKIQLIAANTMKGCRDTASVTVMVKYVNAAFAFSSSYIGNSKCLPAVVSFTNTSSNVSQIKWDFGDGTQSINIFNPTHVYTKAGRYTVQVTTQSDNGTVYVTKDSVVIDAPVVTVKANILHSCTAQSITFSAIAHDAVSYLWDFGDGNIYESSDTFAVHNYPAAGIYIPHIIATDSSGCSNSVNKSDTIIIDSLNVSLADVPGKICAPKNISFDPDIVSVSGDASGLALSYHWNFGTGNPSDTSNQKDISFIYQQPGNYPVSLKVQSQYGCMQQVLKNIVAAQGLNPFITGPSEICESTNATFMGNIQIPGTPAWLWLFDDGSTTSQQNPLPKKYDNPGTFPVKLIVDNNGCVDTVIQMLQVDANPMAVITPQNPNLCEGSSIVLTASGGSDYKWAPATSLNSIATAMVNASPLEDITYFVTVANSKGCTNKDSIKVNVIHPFKMQAKDPATVCSGQSITLEVSGAYSYKWINNTAGLSSTSIANPVASPAATMKYTVTGTDSYQCFTDTSNITIKVASLPVTNAGPGGVILTGSSYQLQSTSSPDVVKWEWNPPGSLSCNNCATPLAKPSKSEIYTLTVANAAGCTASDTVSVKLFCSSGRIFIPNAFTPNKDGLNELFSIKGDGISDIEYFRIYDRWGTLVFEHNNFQMGDKSGSWDGRYKGEPVAQGVYIYFAALSCGQETYLQKGTVTVLY